ncbi:unnamed protein product, partial [Discosporangium mesarthrocarpum]
MGCVCKKERKECVPKREKRMCAGVRSCFPSLLFWCSQESLTHFLSCVCLARVILLLSLSSRTHTHCCAAPCLQQADEAKKEKKLAKDSSSVPDSQRQPATE